MKIAFTICSNNYLAQAKILGDSLLQHNPEYKFIIGLCDEFSKEIDYVQFDKFEIVPFIKIGISNFNEIVDKYDIIELNTSIKPSFFKYLIESHSTADKIIYFDPDIQIFNKFNTIESYLEKDDIIITPHILNSISIDDLSPSENLFLNYGLYNLGFIAINAKSMNAKGMLDWWEIKTLNIGFNRISEGLFVDQLWINLAPILFHKVKIAMDLGFNVAPWNLHERSEMEKINGEYVMKDNSKLVFFHFSSFNYKTPEKLSNKFNRFEKMKISNYFFDLYENYYQELIFNDVESISEIKCFYQKKKVEKNKTKLILISLIPPLFFFFFRTLKSKIK